MKNTLRILSLVAVMVLCFGLLAACGNSGDAQPTQTNPVTDPSGTTAPAGTEPFVAPADQVGKVVAADSTLITWNTYKTDDDTIDFMGVNVKELGDAAEEMTLFYLEADVTYYKISEGKLVEAAVEDVVAGSVIGITTLEEGVQEVYIISVPVVDEGSDEYEDTLEEIIEETTPATTAATEPATPDELATEPTTGEDVSNEETPEDVYEDTVEVTEATEATEAA